MYTTSITEVVYIPVKSLKIAQQHPAVSLARSAASNTGLRHRGCRFADKEQSGDLHQCHVDRPATCGYSKYHHEYPGHQAHHLPCPEAHGKNSAYGDDAAEQ